MLRAYRRIQNKNKSSKKIIHIQQKMEFVKRKTTKISKFKLLETTLYSSVIRSGKHDAHQPSTEQAVLELICWDWMEQMGENLNSRKYSTLVHSNAPFYHIAPLMKKRNSTSYHPTIDLMQRDRRKSQQPRHKLEGLIKWPVTSFLFLAKKNGSSVTGINQNVSFSFSLFCFLMSLLHELESRFIIIQTVDLIGYHPH